jgi:galactokinase
MAPAKENAFQITFRCAPQVLSSAPGRINIIGEHTDYNNGYVLPAAINLRTFFLAAARPDHRVRVRAENFGEEETFDLEAIAPSPDKRWANYVKGIFWVLRQAGHRIGGLNALVWGDVPLESGLSSSAALEVSVIKGACALLGIDLPGLELARLAQRAENEFVGVKCGLMDQFISVFGRKDSALFLDCETLDYSYYPLNLARAGLSVLVYDTKVPRRLAASEYNRRRQESGLALEVLKRRGVRSFKEATTALLESCREEMGPVPFQRARHVVTENGRVRRAVEALQKDDFEALGKLLFHSHESLRDDYEVSCRELDLLYEIGRDFPGCLGARLVGAGFGGSGIAIVEKRAGQEFRTKLVGEAQKRGFPRPEFHEVAIGHGAEASRVAKSGSPSSA